MSARGGRWPAVRAGDPTDRVSSLLHQAVLAAAVLTLVAAILGGCGR